MNFPLIQKVVLFGLAIYGAGLSTFNSWQALRKERRRVRVTASLAMVMTQIEGGDRAFLAIEATNVGTREVNITQLGPQLPDRTLMIAPFPASIFVGAHTQLPAAITDGQVAKHYIGCKELAPGLHQRGINARVSVRPLCKDSAGGVYRGGRFVVDPAKYAHM